MKVFLVLFLIVLIAVGICLLLNIGIVDIVEFSRRQRQAIRRKRTLKSTAESFGNKQKKHRFFIAAEIASAKELLKETKKEKGYTRMIVSCIVLAVIGAGAAVFGLRNILAAPFLAVVGMLIPIWRQKIYKNKYEKYVDVQLESAVSLITTSYLRQNNIIEAVKENIPSIDDVVREPFERFVAETAINPDVTDCIKNLQSSIKNSIFYDWCDVLIKTYENSEVKENLVVIAKKFSTVRIMQSELDAETVNILSDYIILILMNIAIYPLVWIVNRTWFAMYLNTVAGNICVVISCIVIIYAVAKVISLLRPVKFER